LEQPQIAAKVSRIDRQLGSMSNTEYNTTFFSFLFFLNTRSCFNILWLTSSRAGERGLGDDRRADEAILVLQKTVESGVWSDAER
jgi:hypothetical protein